MLLRVRDAAKNTTWGWIPADPGHLSPSSQHTSEGWVSPALFTDRQTEPPYSESPLPEVPAGDAVRI